MAGVGKALGRAGQQFAGGMARDIASAATRSLIEGSDFGDNMLAGLPDVLAQTLVAGVQDGIDAIRAHQEAQRAAAAGVTSAANSIETFSKTPGGQYLISKGATFEATAGGIIVHNAPAGSVLDADTTIRTGLDYGFAPYDANTSKIVTDHAPWQAKELTGGDLYFKWDELGGEQFQSRWITVGDGGAVRLISRGDGPTYLALSGDERIAGLGLTLSFGAPPPPDVVITGRRNGRYSLGALSVMNSPLVHRYGLDSPWMPGDGSVIRSGHGYSSNIFFRAAAAIDEYQNQAKGTLQIGFAGAGQLGPIALLGGGGFAFDAKGNVGSYEYGGIGGGEGLSGDVDLSAQASKLDSILDLRGQFYNESYHGGDGVGGSIDVFQDSQGRTVGGGATMGLNAGASGSVATTYTFVQPLANPLTSIKEILRLLGRLDQ
jgi:hypothetical protein